MNRDTTDNLLYNIGQLLRSEEDTLAVSAGQKLYATTLRGWRDQYSWLPKLYELEASEDKPWAMYNPEPLEKRYITIVDEAERDRMREIRSLCGRNFYEFINGHSLRVRDSEPEAVKIEFSLSDLVGEE